LGDDFKENMQSMLVFDAVIYNADRLQIQAPPLNQLDRRTTHSNRKTPPKTRTPTPEF